MKSETLDRAAGKIKQLLAQKEMEEKDLAKVMGLTEGEISHLLGGQRKLEFDDLEGVAAA